MKKIDTLKEVEMFPKKTTVKFILDFSKSLSVVKTKKNKSVKISKN